MDRESIASQGLGSEGRLRFYKAFKSVTSKGIPQYIGSALHGRAVPVMARDPGNVSTEKVSGPDVMLLSPTLSKLPHRCPHRSPRCHPARLSEAQRMGGVDGEARHHRAGAYSPLEPAAFDSWSVPPDP